MNTTLVELTGQSNNHTRLIDSSNFGKSELLTGNTPAKTYEYTE